MRKSELFAQILECVAFETEIAKEQILSKDKFQDVVDARYMLVHFCHKNGMYITDIARMMRCSSSTASNSKRTRAMIACTSATWHWRTISGRRYPIHNTWRCSYVTISMTRTATTACHLHVTMPIPSAREHPSCGKR